MGYYKGKSGGNDPRVSQIESQLAQKVTKGAGEVTPQDLSEETLGLVTGTGTVNLLTIPQDKSVTAVKLDPVTSARGFVWQNSPQYKGFNRAINPQYYIGGLGTAGEIQPSTKNRAYSDLFTFTKIKVLNPLYQTISWGLTGYDANGAKVTGAGTAYITTQEFEFTPLNGAVQYRIAFKLNSDATLTDADIQAFMSNVMVCEGSFQIPFNLRSHEGDYGHIFSPYPIKVNTTAKTVTADGTYVVMGGKKYVNNMAFDISNLDLTQQGTFFIDWTANKIKWMARGSFASIADDNNYTVVGQSWTTNGTYGNYIMFFTDADIYVDGVKQRRNGFSDRLKNKKFLFDGDSITWGWLSTGRTTTTYPQVISNRLGVAHDNIAVSGACVSPKTPADGQSLAERSATNNYVGYEAIIMAAGTNDYGFEIPVGTINDTSINTFYGAWNTIIERIYTQNKSAKLFLVTPIYRHRYEADYTVESYSYANTAGHTLGAYCDAIVDIGLKYGIPVYDSRLNNFANKFNYEVKLADSLHPTPDTYIEMGNKIASFIESKC